MGIEACYLVFGKDTSTLEIEASIIHNAQSGQRAMDAAASLSGRESLLALPLQAVWEKFTTPDTSGDNKLLAGMDTYQERAYSTSLKTEVGGKREVYAALKLAGESGEVAELVGKCYRDNDGVWDGNWSERLRGELGDVLWYVSELASVMGMSLGMVALANNNKLARRKSLGKIQGSGSDR